MVKIAKVILLKFYSALLAAYGLLGIGVGVHGLARDPAIGLTILAGGALTAFAGVWLLLAKITVGDDA